MCNFASLSRFSKNVGTTVKGQSKKDHLVKRFFVLFSKGSTELAEVFTGASGLVWGVWLSVPGLAVPSSFVIPIPVKPLELGLAFIVLGVYGILSAASGTLHHRRVSTFLSFLTWSFVTVAFLFSSAVNLGVGFYGLYTLFTLYLHVRLILRGQYTYDNPV